jgi:cytochrome d ubiquinol oxidase subunit II
MRGVPLSPEGYFFLPLWTNFQPGATPGILDWYTVLCALATTAAVSLHGALFLVWKTEGALNARVRRIALGLWPALIVLSGAALAATIAIRPQLLENYISAPVGWLLPLLVAAGIAGMFYFTRVGRERAAFLSSCLHIVATLGGAAFALYPTLLPGVGGSRSITIHNAAAGPQSLSMGLIWWSFGMAVAIGYFVLVYSMFRGKVRGHDYAAEGHD